MAPTVLKLGGELIDDAAKVRAMAGAIVSAAARLPLVVVHGGGREVDAALSAVGIAKQQVDGVRVTDAATLGVVVPVLAGTINTRFVAAIGAVGGRAVGLTGADATVGPVTPMAPISAVDGRVVPLGFVGQPVVTGEASLLTHLVSAGFIPVVASIGAGHDGTLYNVNADTMAAAVAVRIRAGRLVIAGTTPGVLDADGRNLQELSPSVEAGLVAAKTVNAGMIAKLKACRDAQAGGVETVVIADGRDAGRLLTALLAGADRCEGATAITGGERAASSS